MFVFQVAAYKRGISVRIFEHYKMRLRNYKCLVCVGVLVYIYHFFGVSDYVRSRSFENNFDYPLDIDIKPLVEDVISGRKPSVDPINYYRYRFLSNSGVCSTMNKIDLFIAVKSAMKNFGNREAIRKTYGRAKIEGKNIKTLFFLGVDGAPKSNTQKRIDKEMAEFTDIIQIDFRDNYFNNTIKTMMAFRWLYERCSDAQYYLFTDDDMYISVTNLLGYVAGLSKATSVVNETEDWEGRVLDRDGAVFAGYVFISAPQRFHSSKWRVSVEEYQWDRWPAYVTAGAYVVSNKAMKRIYAGSLFVKHFRFDDIYLGIVAKKVGIEPIHCPQFHFYKKRYSKVAYRSLIASHGYSKPEELVKVWNAENG